MTRFAVVPAFGTYAAKEMVHARSVSPRHDRAVKAAAKIGGRVIHADGRLSWSGSELDEIPTAEPGAKPSTGKPRRNPVQVRLDDDELAAVTSAVRRHNAENPNPKAKTTISDWIRRYGVAAAQSEIPGISKPTS